MRRYFFNKMVGDSGFVTLFGATAINDRIGQPFAAQSAAYPLINIRDLGAFNGGLLRPQNPGQDYVWAQRKYLVTAIKDVRAYPEVLAEYMTGLFRLAQGLAVTGGRIIHCYMEDLEAFHVDQYVKDGKTYSEQGSVWVIAAKAD
jgi:hypothetical protein